MYTPQNASQLFKQLYEKAEEARSELSRPWFDMTLFSCRSTVIRDYVAEAEQTWKRCEQLQASSSQQQWLHERLDRQLTTLVQALYRGKPPKASSSAQIAQQQEQQQQALRNQQSKDLVALYQQLKQYKEYEVRLTDNLKLLQQEVSALALVKSATKQHQEKQQETQRLLLVAQQRLQRCQRAIAGVDRAIAKIER
ncbi:hypothetical protein CWE15_07620 [Aliidiomarina taiwanensis]|uniref:Primosomal replication protein N n=1 Tax=Aliidiomarina taiwanensis TaxID=946228 RepID=A0A432X235_9GAMM|nr:primosomal replication protein PriC [Aliidiomarina taiwanensis]RUO40605.1 hypothetical protein CWE15_07620 [Aliidiomarina taiwanensis]